MDTQVLDSLAAAIARMEGFFKAGSRAARNNNPGNMRETARRIYADLPRDDQGFIVFPTAAAGWTALKKDLTIKANRGWSLERIINAWAPASDGNNTPLYIANVVAWTGIPAGAVVQSWMPGAAPPGGGSSLPGSLGVEVAGVKLSDEAVLGAGTVALISAAFLLV